MIVKNLLDNGILPKAPVLPKENEETSAGEK